MTARTRSRSQTSIGSQKIAPSGANPSYTNTSYSETCNDVIHDYPRDHTLTLDKTIRDVQPFSGDTKTSPTDSTYGHSYSNYWPTYPRTTAVNHLAVSGVPSNNEVAIDTVNRSNPSNPVVDLPLSFYELKDLPMLVMQVHRNLRAFRGPNGNSQAAIRWTQEVAGNILAFEFGIKPLISDIQKLVRFQTEVAKRVSLLDKLYNKGGLRYKSRPSNHSSYSRTSVTADSSAGIVPCTVDTITTVSKWGSTRWSPDPSAPRPATQDDLLALATKAAYAREITLDSLWNAMPYSWMVDWFSNMGDYINSHRNTVPAVHSSACVMTHTKTTMTGKCNRASYSNLKGGDFTLTRETKSRAVMPFLLPEAHIPFLNERQVSILGSLAVTRIPRNLF
ncbi:MAG: putative maturation protein [Koroslivirus allofaecihabitans]|uniref:Maturation protein n=1 Tax=Leviviridae sp. TaxID=2027243 RepID=A0ABY3SSV0_9VIRU|nr:MAG: putative maturation protein [Leviviridae sp.]